MINAIMAYFGMSDKLFATLVLLIISGEVISLLFGWYYGARRLELDLHHIIVYSNTAIISLIVLIWMGPRAINALDFFLSNVPTTLPYLIHIVLGIITVVCMLLVVGSFLYTRTITLDLLRRHKPIMILILILFPVVFLFGVWIYLGYW